MIQLDHQFRVPLPIDQAWKVLTDLPTVARCLPGAHLDSTEGGRYEGGLSTRIGPISAKYRGSAHFIERDDVGHRAVIEARGQEAKGNGTASAVISLTLQAYSDATEVTVASELAISGKAAQFGRGLLAEVSSAMLDTFVSNLERSIETNGSSAPDSAPPAATATASAERAANPTADGPSRIAPGRATGHYDTSEQLDLVTTIVTPLLRQASRYLAGAAIGILVGVILGRISRRDSSRPGWVQVQYPASEILATRFDRNWEDVVGDIGPNK